MLKNKLRKPGLYSSKSVHSQELSKYENVFCLVHLLITTIVTLIGEILIFMFILVSFGHPNFIILDKNKAGKRDQEIPNFIEQNHNILIYPVKYSY